MLQVGKLAWCEPGVWEGSFLDDMTRPEKVGFGSVHMLLQRLFRTGVKRTLAVALTYLQGNGDFSLKRNSEWWSPLIKKGRRRL